MTRRQDRIEAAAVIFGFFTREQTRLTSIFKITPQALRLWIKDDVFHAKLDALGYTGDRSLIGRVKRDPLRDTPEQVQAAEKAYQEAVDTGVPQRKRVDYVSRKSGVEKRTVRNYMHRFGWHDERP